MYLPPLSSLVPLVLSLFFPSNFRGPVADNGLCFNPAVRREWRALTKAERAEWIGAVKCLANLPHDSNLIASVDPSLSGIGSINASASYYDDLVYMHMVDLNLKVHFTGLFLPWHRWYIQVFETALQTECGFTGTLPYWNWVLDSEDVFNSPIFLDMNSESGFGGWGDPENDFEVPDGGFSPSSSFALAYPSPHTLRRNFTSQPFRNSLYLSDADRTLAPNETFTPAERDKLVHGFVGEYTGFQTYLEGFNGSHSAIHLMMRGDMGGDCPASAPPDCIGGPTFSPNEPLFWLHHAMIDKLWSDWQNADPANKRAFSGGSVQALDNATYYQAFPNGAPPFLYINSTMPADSLFPEPTIESVMSTTEGMHCYVYE